MAQHTLAMPARRRESSLGDSVATTDETSTTVHTRGRPSLMITSPSYSYSASGQPSPAVTSPSVLTQQQILVAVRSLRVRTSSSMRSSVPPPLQSPTRQSSVTSVRASTSSYYNPLGSDLNDDDAYDILQELTKSEPYLRSFSDAELHELCATFTILKIEQGETVMKVGESASFFALLLQGSCVATVNASIGSLPLPRGSWLGEMSYFEHVVRSADVSAAEDSVLAMMTYKELDALAHSAPAIHSKLLKLLAVVSIRKLHERIDVMHTSTAATATLAHARKGSLVAAGEMYLKSPSAYTRKTYSYDNGAESVKELRRSPSNGAAGLPYGISTVATPRATSMLHSHRSFSYSNDNEAVTQPTTPRPPHLPKSPRVAPTPVNAPSTDLLTLRQQQETLLRKRLATTLQIREAVIWQDSVTADFESAERSSGGEYHRPARPGYDADDSAENSPASSNRLLQLCPSMADLKQLTHKQKLEVWDLYHHHQPGSSSKAMQPAELRALSRDVIELVLRNYVQWLKRSSQSKKSNKLTETDFRIILANEREYLLPGKKGQTDVQAINAMGRHLTSQLTAAKSKGAAPSTLKSSMPTVTEDIFCLAFDRVLRNCLQIKTKDEGLGCSIQ